MRGVSTTAVCVFLSLTSFQANAQSKPIIQAEELAERLSQDTRPTVLDTRPEADYRQGHIPGALRIDVDRWRSKSLEPNGLFDDQFWSHELGQLGLTLDSHVVVAGDSLPETARIWWLLRYCGIAGAQVLDGGYRAWQEEDLKLSTEQPTKAAVQNVRVAFQSDLLATLDEVNPANPAALQCTLWDTRSESEFDGSRGVGARTGHIPGARHLEWQQLVDEDGRLLSVEQLRKRLEPLELEGTVVTHCQTGGRSSVAVLALELLGHDKVKNYYRGWSEYSDSLTAPVE